MLLRHATPRKNLTGIKRAGLLTPKAIGKSPAVWLHSPGCSAWAALHAIKRHGGRVEGVVVLELDVPRRGLWRSKRGLWYCPRDIPPGRIHGVVTFAALARFPAGETAGR